MQVAHAVFANDCRRSGGQTQISAFAAAEMASFEFALRNHLLDRQANKGQRLAFSCLIPPVARAK